LAAVGVPFAVVDAVAEESMHGDPAATLAESNARAKARGAVLPVDATRGCFVLGADTIVVVDGRVLGKPTDAEDARAMLASLAGRAHQVITGVALERRGGHEAPAGRGGSLAGDVVDTDAVTVVAGAVATTVRFQPLVAADLDAYVASGEWAGKAGGYAIQGLAAVFTPDIEGDYANVVGLPLSFVAELFRRLGFDLLRRSWTCPADVHKVYSTV
jgi:septum formation protein